MTLKRQNRAIVIPNMERGAIPMDKKMTPEECEEAIRKVFVKNMSRPESTNKGLKSQGLTREDFAGVVGKDDHVDQVIEYGMNRNLIGISDDGTYSPTEDGLARFWP